MAENTVDIAAWECQEQGDIDSLQRDLKECINRLDGTNACPFLAIKTADKLYSNPKVISNIEAIIEKVENVLENLQSQINDTPDAAKLSYISEAIKLLKEKGLLGHQYSMLELVNYNEDRGNNTVLLCNAVMKLTQFDVSLAVYRCNPICNSIGFINNTFVIIDTYHIGMEIRW